MNTSQTQHGEQTFAARDGPGPARERPAHSAAGIVSSAKATDMPCVSPSPLPKIDIQTCSIR